MKVNKTFKVFSVVVFLSLNFSFNSLFANNNSSYSVCEGRGEKCSVVYNGVPVGFTKSKDSSAIVIKF
jgi:hypothetical protein